jgi:tol-pal system protein YbgF
MRLRLGLASAFIAAIFMMVAGALPAFAQNTDLRSLLDRLDRLERDIRTLNVQLSRGGGAALPKGGAATITRTTRGAVPGAAPSGHALARIEVRFGALEEELRASTGRVEGLGHVLDQVSKRLDKLVADVDFRLSALERAASAVLQGTAAGPPQLSAAPSPPSVQQVIPGADGQGFAKAPQNLGTISQSALGSAPVAGSTGAAQPLAAPPAAEPDVLPEGTPDDQYRFAFGLLRQARYDDAEVALRAFLRAHGSDALARNARYWLGETYYVRGDYKQAAVVFYEGYNSAPKGPKAADTLLKLGMSLASIEKKKLACATFDKLAKEFPDVAPNIAKLVTRERQRVGCK